MMHSWIRRSFSLLAFLGGVAAAQTLSVPRDLTHVSSVLQETRSYRIFLPSDYDSSGGKRYPVVYFFHGFGERFNLTSEEVGDYDAGYKGNNLAAYAGSHDVIIVRPDGYNPRFPGEARQRPYNVCPFDQPASDCTPGDTNRDFALYFVELMNYVDSTYRTIADRDHRATAGISMGGWMSYWLAGKYPQLIGSASSFMGGPEFVAGPKEFATELSPNHLYRNFEGQRTRFVTGTDDFVRWYHREMHKIWNFTRSNHEVEEFVSAHGTPGIDKTMDFHMASFANPLPRPAVWSHADLYPDFQVWGYAVNSNRRRAGFTVLEDVSAAGFRSSVREFLPNGRLLSQITLNIVTDAVYVPNAVYQIVDADLDVGQSSTSTQRADSGGRLRFTLRGNRHEIGITASAGPVLALTGWRLVSPDLPMAGQTLRLRLGIVNKGSAAAGSVTVRASSPNAQVVVQAAAVTAPNIGAGHVVETSHDLLVTVSDARREMLTLNVRLEANGRSFDGRLSIPLVAAASELPGVSISDGATRLLWKRAVVQESGVLGTGNADGVASSGESLVFQMQDGAAFRSGEVLAADPCVDLVDTRAARPATDYTRLRLRDQWADYDSVGGTQKFSVPLLTASCAAGKDLSFYVKFVYPNAPEHVIRQGVVKVRMGRRDATGPEALGAQVVNGNRLEVELRDGGIVTAARARLEGPGGVFRVPLRDDGLSGDVTSGDAIYTALVGGVPAGSYSLVIEAVDGSGNSASRSVAGTFVF